MPVRHAELRVAWNELRVRRERACFAGVGAEVAPAGDDIGKKLVLPAWSSMYVQ